MARVIGDLPDVLAAALHRGIPELDTLIQRAAIQVDPGDPPVADMTAFATDLWALFVDQAAAAMRDDASMFDAGDGEDDEPDCPSCDVPMRDIGGRTRACDACGYTEPS